MKREKISAMTIRKITPADLEFAAACTAAEGWHSETRGELTYLFNHNRNGCLICETDTGPAGICFATSYGEVGFIGELIVAAEQRGNGIGARLMMRCIASLREAGAKRILLDAAPLAVPLYERLGFRKICRSLRFLKQPAAAAGAGAGAASTAGSAATAGPAVRAMTPADLAAVNGLDFRAFGADRSFFLSRRLRDNPKLCFVQESSGNISGFIAGRAGNGIYSAGPWVGRQGVDAAGPLLAALNKAISDRPLRIGILEDNKAASRLVTALGFELQIDPCWRMILGEGDYPESREMVFAIGGPAKG